MRHAAEVVWGQDLAARSSPHTTGAVLAEVLIVLVAFG